MGYLCEFMSLLFLLVIHEWIRLSEICWKAHRGMFELITGEECEESQHVKHAVIQREHSPTVKYFPGLRLNVNMPPLYV